MKFRASGCYWSQGQFRDKGSPRPLDRVVAIGATYRISAERAAGHVREVRDGNRETKSNGSRSKLANESEHGCCDDSP